MSEGRSDFFAELAQNISYEASDQGENVHHYNTNDSDHFWSLFILFNEFAARKFQVEILKRSWESKECLDCPMSDTVTPTPMLFSPCEGAAPFALHFARLHESSARASLTVLFSFCTKSYTFLQYIGIVGVEQYDVILLRPRYTQYWTSSDFLMYTCCQLLPASCLLLAQIHRTVFCTKPRWQVLHKVLGTGFHCNDILPY